MKIGGTKSRKDEVSYSYDNYCYFVIIIYYLKKFCANKYMK